MNSRPTFTFDRREPIGEPRFAPSRPPRTPPEPGYPMRVLTSAEIFVGCREVGIEHEGSLYRLKITRQGKLILNK